MQYLVSKANRDSSSGLPTRPGPSGIMITVTLSDLHTDMLVYCTVVQPTTYALSL